MFYRSKIRQTSLALALVAMLLFGGILLPATAPSALAQSESFSMTANGPTYVTPGSNITYELTLKNPTSQVVTDIMVWNPLPVNTTYVSGGAFNAGPNRVEFTLASLAANTTHTFAWVVKVGPGVAIDTVIENKDIEIASFTIGGNSFSQGPFAVGTTVEAPGTLVAVYKDSNGTPFDVVIDGSNLIITAIMRPAILAMIWGQMTYLPCSARQLANRARPRRLAF